MKRFLGIVCLIYDSIIIYTIITDKLKYFLSQTLQIYIKLSIVPLLILALILLLNKNISYKFKKSDLILLLPLLMIFLCGNAKFEVSLANNRILNNNSMVEEEVDIQEEIELDNKYVDIDFTNVDFDIVDEAYSYLTNYFLTTKYASNHIGQTIRYRGFVVNSKYVPKGYFAIGKYEISCCAADASLVGFISKYNKTLTDGKWVEVEGVLQNTKYNGKDIVVVDIINIKEIDDQNEELYVYPCYSYDDEGSCKAIMNYTLY